MTKLTKAMQKKEAQRAEMRREFIEAALQIIETQGTEALSTRKLSEVTGYSYATLYNHFPNMSALYQYCIYEHMTAMERSILNGDPLSGLSPRDSLLKLSALFADYMLQHPKTFELIFIVPIASAPPEEIREALLSPQIIMTVRGYMTAFLKTTPVKPEDYEAAIQVLLSHLVGRLLFYFKRTALQEPSAFLQAVEKEVCWILNSLTQRSEVHETFL